MLHFENDAAVKLYCQIRMLGATVSSDSITESCAREILGIEEMIQGRKTELCLVDVGEE